MTQTTVLLVDDSKVSRMMINAIIKDQHEDWDVIEAGDADEALALTDDHRQIDLMIIDYNMPGMNGLDLATELKHTYIETPIYLLTANVQESTKNKADALGVSFQSKPITEDKIKDIINKVN